MADEIKKFIGELRRSLSAETFVKATFGNYKGTDDHPQKLAVRLIETKKGPRLMLQYRYATRDAAANYDLDEGAAIIEGHLESGFRSAHLFTTSGDFQLTIGKRNARLSTGKPTFAAKPAPAHDREKRYTVDPHAYYLKVLGITTDNGEIRAAQQDKWRQINKFVEIVAGLYANSPLKNRESLRIVDMGSGKGYLTFALYDYFQNILSVSPAVAGGLTQAGSKFQVPGFKLRNEPETLDLKPETHLQPPATAGGTDPSRTALQITGVDTKREIVDLCNQIAKAGGYDGLNFVYGTIADFDPGDVDILIALHACDTATDDALYKGITAKAEIIIAAPCCHKEIRRQIKPPEMLKGILKHGTMLERTAETITDGLRSLLLERSGYSTKIFEFIPVEHTPKNNMIVATRSRKPPDLSDLNEQITAVKTEFGIERQRLETLLA